MKWWKAILLACFAAGALAAEHGQFSAANPAIHIAGTVAAQNSLLRILSPVPSQQLSTSYVDVNYELVNPGVSGGSPDFQVQLDGREPVSTNRYDLHVHGAHSGSAHGCRSTGGCEWYSGHGWTFYGGVFCTAGGSQHRVTDIGHDDQQWRTAGTRFGFQHIAIALHHWVRSSARRRSLRLADPRIGPPL